MNKHEEKACRLFSEGYNCAQAVTAAFSEEIGMSEKQAAKLASAFGGGMGGQREICGAVSGMYIILGILYGYDDAKADEAKKKIYSQVQKLSAEFKEEYKTIICRELLGIEGAQKPEPAPRSPELYAQRPCLAFVASAARILSEFIDENK